MSAEQIKVLFVYPRLDNALALRELLTKTGEFVFYRVKRADEAIRRVANGGYHVVITDLDLPDSTGPDFVARLREVAPSIPIVVISDGDEVESGLAVVQAGAQDYILSQSADPGAIYRAIRFAIVRARLSGEVSSSTSQQIEIKDQFLCQFSHELRSPITAIYVFITILLDGLAGDLTQKQREYLDITLRNVNQMRDMVRDLMDVARAQTGKLTIRPRCTSVVTMIAETVLGLQTAANARNITLAPVDLQCVPPVMADPARISQILNNLCDNALKFCSAGDTITLSAGVFEQGPEGVPEHVPAQNPGFVYISVQDTGIGISKDGKEQVFEYMYQDQPGLNYNHKGLGIGLSICRELVNQHGGRIWVESEPGKGSKFTFLLPRFRLTDFSVPICSDIDPSKANMYVITAEIRNGPLAKCQLSESARQRIWDCLEREKRTVSEVLLPRMSSRPEHELIFLVANSAEPIPTDEIRTRLMRDAQLDETLVDVRISAESIYTSQMSEHGVDMDVHQTDGSNISNKIEHAIESRIRR